MHNFLKKLLGKKDPETVVIPFTGIPAWLNEHEKTARATLLAKTSGPEKNIRDAMADLQNIVNSVARAEHDPEIHPKLKNIAKNSLPLFVKAMHASLARELPEDCEEFYTAAVECLKGCLNSTRGQGRYLQIVFPDEMKAVRIKIDVIGREINQITVLLADFRKEKTLIDDAKAVYAARVDIDLDRGKADGKDQRIARRIKDMAERVAAIEKELAALSSDERMTEVSGLALSLREQENQRDTAARTYAALSMTTSHVLRKAEKIAVKQKHSSEIAVLRHTIELLSDHTVPDANVLLESLAAACLIAERMIASGEIALKNKEERTIFSDTRSLSNDMCSSSATLLEKDEACRIAQEKLTLHPLLVKRTSLEREKSQLEAMLIKEEHVRTELEEWRAKTNERVPVLEETLYKKIELILGEGVELQIDGQQKAQE
jgi:hypothetical protein